MIAKSILVVTSMELIQATPLNSLRNIEQNPLDRYCGTSWPEAAEACPLPCSSGSDEECTPLGGDFKCFGYTGCSDKVTLEGGITGGNSFAEEESEGSDGDDVIAANKFCGATW
jgi:hypothetical protein